MAERKRRHGKLYLLLMALAAAGAAIWVGSSVLSVEEFAFTGARLPAGWDGGRLVVLSDLHGKRFGRQHSRLLEAVRGAKPDAICLCGDMMDEWSGTEYLRPLLEGLAEIAPVYYVTGNHEWASGRMPEMRQLLEETGVTYLSNTFVPLERNGDTITLAGIDDPNGYADQKTPEELAAEVYAACGDPFWLLLAHRNDRFAREYSLLGADLTISGHGHGGIWRFPFVGGVFGTQRNLFPTHTAGFYSDNGASVFVNRGLGNSPRVIPRILNRPQVAVITLERG